MSVDGVSGDALKSLSGNYTMFLRLLTTQLQYQDPTNPTDSNTFTQQLVAYSQVEQQIKTNDNLTTLIGTTQAGNNANIALLNYLGKYVEVSGDNLSLINGAANATYELAKAADKVQLDILDTSGKTVATFNGPNGAGVQKIAWDGKDNNGAQLSDGKYTLKITATDPAGKAIMVTKQSLVGPVTSIERTATGNVLHIGNLPIAEEDITNVYGNA